MTDEQETVDAEVIDEAVDARTGEVVPYTPPAAPTSWTPRRTGRELAMMNRDTDSWTVVVRDVGYLASQIADTTMVPKALRGDPAAVTAVILHGRELGLAPMTSLSLTHVVEGKVALTAEGMRGLIIDDGHELKFEESTSSTCTIAGRRSGTDRWQRVTWTIADAQRAGVASKQVWKSYPRRMLQARATSELAQTMFPDVIHGLRTTEELEDMSDLADAAGPSAPAPAAPSTRVQRKPPATRAKAIEQAPPEGEIVQNPATAVEPEPEQPARRTPPRTRGTKTAAGDGGGATSPAATTPEPESSPGDTDQGAGSTEQPAQEGEPLGIPQSAEGSAPDLVTHLAGDDERGLPSFSDDPLPMDEPPVTGLQRGKIMAECTRFGITDRTERLTYLATIADLDAPLGSTNDLTKVQASLILDRMAACEDRVQLDERVMNR